MDVPFAFCNKHFCPLWNMFGSNFGMLGAKTNKYVLHLLPVINIYGDPHWGARRRTYALHKVVFR